MSSSIKFRIPTLDALTSQIAGQPPEGRKIVCIQGPVGSGKSTLCLHAASAFIHAPQNAQRVLFISTDLRFSEAVQAWGDFALNVQPNWLRRKANQLPPISIEMVELVFARNPTSSSSRYLPDWLATTHLASDEKCGFLDMSSITVGDEWGFLERMLASLPTMPSTPVSTMIVLDSLSGIDVLSTRGSHRESTPSQEHLNRLIPLLGCNTHFVFTARKDDPTALLIREEAQADLAYELGFRSINGALHRTIRIVKARTLDHPLDEHFLCFRGRPSYSAREADRDVNYQGLQIPRVDLIPNIVWLNTVQKNTSLDTLRLKHSSSAAQAGLCAFGIHLLDPMLAGENLKDGDRVPRIAGDAFGIPSGSSISISGPPRTHKSELGLNFLCHTFAYSVRFLMTGLDAICPKLKGNDTFERDYPHGKLAEQRRLLKLLSAMGTSAKNSSVTDLQDQFCFALQSLIRSRQAFSSFSDFTAVNPSLRSVAPTLSKSLPQKIAAILDLLLLPQFCRQGILITERQREPSTLSAEFTRHLMAGFDSNLKVIASRFEYAKLLSSSEAFFPLFEALLQQIITRSLYCRCLAPSERLGAYAFHTLRRYVHVAAANLHEHLKELPEQSPLLGPANKFLVRRSWHSGRGVFGHSKNRQSSSMHILEWESDATRDLCVQRPPSGNLRVVLDDILALSGSDSHELDGFRQLLATYLDRNGITAVLVESHPTEDRAMDTIDLKGVHSLPTHAIRVNRLRFAHGVRIGFTIDPPYREEFRGVVRELRSAPQTGSLYVDPNLELYSHLEAGRPSVIPLEIRLFAETVGCAKYIEAESRYLQQSFDSAMRNADKVPVSIQAVSLDDYYLLQRLCTTPQLAVVDRTMVVQVDGYWNLDRNGDLRSMHHYLNRSLRIVSPEEINFEDQFGAFALRRPQRISTANRTYEKPRRLDYFAITASRPNKSGRPQNPAYQTRIRQDDKTMDRVPFTWDFGFLLLRKDVYDWCRQNPQGSESTVSLRGDSPSTNSGILELLANLDPATNITQNISWHKFLSALTSIANAWRTVTGRSIPILGMGESSPDSLDALTLEVWFSEILHRIRAEPDSKSLQNQFLSSFSAEHFSDPRLSDPLVTWSGGGGILGLLANGTTREVCLARVAKELLLQKKSLTRWPLSGKYHFRNIGFFLELYKTWLLLCDILAPSGLQRLKHSTDLKDSRLSPQQCIAVRHWYKTGCQATNPEFRESCNEHSEYVASRLPGHFSVRGDWYLGVLRSSASARLGELAIDLLSYPDAVRRRLDYGVGLPVRDLRRTYPGKDAELVATALHVGNSGKIRKINLDEMLALGAAGHDSHRIQGDFFWLWRSGLAGYDSQAATFRRWLRDIVSWTIQLRNELSTKWVPGLELYKELETSGLPAFKKIGDEQRNSFVEFGSRCDALIAELNAI